MSFNNIVADELKKKRRCVLRLQRHAGAQLLDLTAGLAETASFVAELHAAEFNLPGAVKRVVLICLL